MELFVYREKKYLGRFLKLDTDIQWTVWYINEKHKISYITEIGTIDIIDNNKGIGL